MDRYSLLGSEIRDVRLDRENLVLTLKKPKYQIRWQDYRTLLMGNERHREALRQAVLLGYLSII